MKNRFKRLLENPIAIRIRDVSFIVLMIAVLIAAGSAVFSYSYFPMRLYKTGKRSIDVVKSKNIGLYVSGHSGAMKTDYYLTGLLTNYSYSVDRKDYQKINVGDSINVLTSEQLKKGMYMGSLNLNATTVLLHYESDGLLYLIFLGAAIILVTITICFLYFFLITQINSNVKEEIENSKNPVNKFALYGKSYTTLLTGIAFSYAFYYLVVNGIYATEAMDSMIAGGIIFLGSLTILSIPIWLYYLKTVLKKITKKKVLYAMQFISFCLGLYTTIKLFIFIHNHSTYKNEDIVKLIVDFFKSLVP